VPLTAEYVIPVAGCEIIKMQTQMVSAVFIYSMGFDFIILTFSAAKLGFPWRGRSQLVRLLSADG
jgi:hypothetical protein